MQPTDTQDTDTRLTVEGVSISFDDFVAVTDVDLTIRTHELVCVVGTSGGGKTTLLRAMAGLAPTAAGSIHLEGAPVSEPTPAVGMIFQQFGLFPWKTVRANITYGLDVRRQPVDDDEIDRLLDLMSLTHAADKYPYQLSGGMQQRVGIARVLAVNPRVLLMDEPFGALDAITRQSLQMELLRLWDQQQDMTAVLVTHDIDEAILLGDRIAVLAGRPGTVRAELDVPIERPRDPERLRFHREYAELHEQVWNVLQDDQEDPPPTRAARQEATS